MKTFTSVGSREPSRFAVRADRWDRLWQEETIERVERLAEISEDLSTVHEAAPDALADLFFILSKASPEPEPNLRADRAVNERIREVVTESDGVRDVRRFSVGSQVQSALGCVTFAPYLRQLYEDQAVQAAQEAAEELQGAQDALAALLGGPGGEQDGEGEDEGEGSPGGAGGDTPGVAEAEQAVADAAGALEDALDRATGRIGQVCRAGAAAMAEQSDERAEAMTSWGYDEGTWDHMDPEEYLDMAEQLRSPQFQQIARVLGKMENARFGAHREKVDAHPTEIYSVEMGNDLARLLPTEKIGLVVPELEDDFYRRYANRELLQYRLKSVEYRATGAVIVIEDSSGSMQGPKHSWSKAFGLALGGIARDEDRAFYALEFGYRGQHKHHPFPDRASWTPPAMIDYASSFLNGGGTDFETPLSAAIEILSEEYEATGRVSADIVLLTDGIASISKAWLDEFQAEKERLSFKVYSLMIGDDARPDVLNQFSDYVAVVRNFFDGTDVRDVFKAVV